MDVKESITSKLQARFAPSRLEVIDESDQHAGHGGWREGQTTHVRIRITSTVFAGQTRVAIHRQINALLAAEFEGGPACVGDRGGGGLKFDRKRP